MRKQQLKFILSIIVLYSMTAVATVKAAPIQFNEVVQVVNPKPGKANTGGFAQLRLHGDDVILTGDDDETKKTAPKPQDDRVIVETSSEIVEDEVCDCVAASVVVGGAFPYGWLALGAIPFVFLIPNNPGDPNTGGTPTPTSTPTPPTTPTMTPAPVPEPMTMFLFGTGLAGIGLAARRRLRKKDKPAA